MTGEELKQLESRLWKAADDLRANSKLTATEYSFPVLGLIFLRHAYSRFVVAKAKIEENLPVHPERGVRAIEKNDFLTAKAIFLSDNAQWDTIANLPDSADLGEEINEAMRSIEREYDVLSGVLPKDYTLFDKDLLQRLIRVFNDKALSNIKGDVFGRIYEYFLNKFAMSGASEGGEFFTPPSLVNTIVNIIEPTQGVILDPAVGSAGMFVQTAHFIEEEGFDASDKVTFYGQEKTETNTKLAKMNMAVHGMDASILQGNTFYEDKHDLIGKCDFVMANPPFNVDGVDKSKDSVKNDERLPFGLPKNDNANYLWIQYFYSYLNESGRAGFVMSASAPDGGHSEKEIRKKLIETGAVDVMVSIGTNFFYTVSLPCTLWFFNRSNEQDAEKSEKTLMLDLRKVYRKVSSNLHDFTDEHLRNIQAIVGLYRGDNILFINTIQYYFQCINAELGILATQARNLSDSYYNELKVNIEKLIGDDLFEEWVNTINLEDIYSTTQIADHYALVTLEYAESGALHTLSDKHVEHFVKAKKGASKFFKDIRSYVHEVGTKNALNKSREWKESVLHKLDEADTIGANYSHSIKQVLYFNAQAEWMISRFPDRKYQDVMGLCKVVSREEITSPANDYSLTPGRYVGVEPQIDEGFDYDKRMEEIRMELEQLNLDAVESSKKVQENLSRLLK